MSTKRMSLSDKLWGFAQNPNDEFALEVLKEAQETVVQSIGFRATAPGTQARQDLHLKEVRDCARFVWKTPEMADTDVEKKLFALPDADLYALLRLYLSLAMQVISPRKLTDLRPRYRTLMQRRGSVMFWTRRMSSQPREFNKLLNVMNEVLQCAGRKYGVSRTPTNKPFLGRLELAQLMDMASWINPYLPVAENHYLAWCIACICGVRPGSLAEARHYKGQFLSWGDLRITRGMAKGMFNVRITFKYLKGNRANLEHDKIIKFHVNSPTSTSYIPMSPAHRLLIIALRRGALKHHKTIDSLLTGSEFNITIETSFLQSPIFIAGKPRGLALTDPPVPMSANSLSSYIQQHAQSAGYGRTISLYAWRRKAATEIRRQKGTEAAKGFLGHEPDTHTMERSYEQGNFDCPVFEIAMRGDVEQAAADMDSLSSMALKRLVDTSRVQGVFLDRAFRRLQNESKELAAAVSVDDYKTAKNIKRRLKMAARKALFDEEFRLQNEEMTVEEVQRRRVELEKPGALMEAILASAKADSGTSQPSSQQSSPKGPARPSEAESSGQRGLPGSSQGSAASHAGAFEYEDIFDAEDDMVQGEEEVTRDVDNEQEAAPEEDETPIEFFEAVRMFMICMSQETFVIRDAKTLTCDLCIADWTIGEKDKVKVWANIHKLNPHRASTFHHEKSAFLRKIEIAALETDPKKYICPYGEDCPAYDDRSGLMRHISRSTAQTTSQDHDDNKHADGWYGEDWDNRDEALDTKRLRDKRATAGIRYADVKEHEEGVMLKHTTTVVLEEGAGADGHGNQPIPEKYRNFIFSGANTGDESHVHRPIPEIYKTIVFSGDQGGLAKSSYGKPIPEAYKSIVKGGDENP